MNLKHSGYEFEALWLWNKIFIKTIFISNQNQMATKKRSGPLHRLSSSDFLSAQMFLETAVFLVVPDEQTQHQSFLKLMPYLFVLKNNGCTFPQLTKLLTEIGFKLKPSSVKNYYNKALPTRMDTCQLQMKEHLSLLENVRKETKGKNMSAISNQVAAIMGQQRTQAASTVESFFGEPDISVRPSSLTGAPKV
jgi:hypothetical protein